MTTTHKNLNRERNELLAVMLSWAAIATLLFVVVA